MRTFRVLSTSRHGVLLHVLDGSDAACRTTMATARTLRPSCALPGLRVTARVLNALLSQLLTLGCAAGPKSVRADGALPGQFALLLSTLHGSSRMAAITWFPPHHRSLRLCVQQMRFQGMSENILTRSAAPPSACRPAMRRTHWHFNGANLDLQHGHHSDF